MSKQITDYFLTEKSSIKTTLEVMGECGEKSAIVVDRYLKILGVVSDGDIRRGLLRGIDLSAEVRTVMNASPKCLPRSSYSQSDVERLFIEDRLAIVPVLDELERVVEVLTWEDIFPDKEKEINDHVTIPTVIMAGGKGTRLQPFTTVLPKPLIPVNGKTVIEHIIDRFRAQGVTEFFISIGFKGNFIRAFFEELDPEYVVNFVEEQKPLGTIGSLKMLDGAFETPFLVTNCDVLVDLDYADFLEFHRKQRSILTIVACSKNMVLPYGVCHLKEEGSLARIEEKPSHHYLINSGVYLFEPEALKYIPDNSRFDITDLLEVLEKAGERVCVYPAVAGMFHDVGEWSAYKQTIEKLS